MIKDFVKTRLIDKYLDCFGDLDLQNPICRKYCALRLKCAIEQVEQDRLMQIDDFIGIEEAPLKLQ
jgi:hypothetical protein